MNITGENEESESTEKDGFVKEKEQEEEEIGFS